jgi:Flp pilus assembly protein TadD
LGNSYYVLGRWDEALAVYRRCQTLQPTHASLCANLGGLLVQMGDSTLALEVYRTGLEANPDSGALNYNLGVLMLQAGDLDEARRLILRAEQLGAQMSPEVRAALAL